MGGLGKYVTCVGIEMGCGGRGDSVTGSLTGTQPGPDGASEGCTSDVTGSSPGCLLAAPTSERPLPTAVTALSSMRVPILFYIRGRPRRGALQDSTCRNLRLAFTCPATGFH